VKIRLVVFDMAGTTVHDDGLVGDCLSKALLTADVAVDRDTVNAVMGEPKPVAIAKLLTLKTGHAVDADDEQVRGLYARFETLMIAHYRSSTDVRPVDGAEEVFRALRSSGIRVALDTGFNRVIVDAILQRLGWYDSRIIDVTVASDEVARGRPFPDLIGRAMQLTRVPSVSEVAKVGDTPADLLEGTAAGCSKVIGITTGSHTREALAAHPHTDLVDHLREVLPLCM
jgi:phosphonatase-like hydrolase